MKKQIIAMGGGGFSMEDNLALDQYILDQSLHPRPKVCFLPTASGDAQSYIDKFYNAYRNLNCRPSHLSLFKSFTADIASFLLSQHGIIVGGGNTKNMLALWKEWGVDQILKQAYEQGIVLAGLSAGSICWFESGPTDSIPGGLNPLKALGVLKGSHCPHYDGEAYRRPAYEKMILEGFLPDGLAMDDGAAIHFVNGEILTVVSSRPLAKAYKVLLEKGSIQELPLEAKLLAPVMPAKKESESQRAFSKAIWEETVGYCRALRRGNQIFVTGTASVADDGAVFATGDSYQQTKRCLALIEKALHDLGADMKHIVRTRMFVTDIGCWEEFGRAHREFFADYPPATTMVEVQRLIHPDLLIEIEADAII